MRRALRAGGCLLILLAAGCSRQEYNGRVAVSGTVTLDGESVPVGQIRFAPIPGTPGPSTGGSITNGRYRLPAESGPGRGEYNITVTAGEPPTRRRFARESPQDHATAAFFRRITQPDHRLDFELQSEDVAAAVIPR